MSKNQKILEIKKSNYKTARSYIIEVIFFACYYNKAKNKIKHKIQLYLVCLLMSLVLVN